MILSQQNYHAPYSIRPVCDGSYSYRITCRTHINLLIKQLKHIFYVKNWFIPQYTTNPDTHLSDEPKITLISSEGSQNC